MVADAFVDRVREHLQRQVAREQATMHPAIIAFANDAAADEEEHRRDLWAIIDADCGEIAHASPQSAHWFTWAYRQQWRGRYATIVQEHIGRNRAGYMALLERKPSLAELITYVRNTDPKLDPLNGQVSLRQQEHLRRDAARLRGEQIARPTDAPQYWPGWETCWIKWGEIDRHLWWGTIRFIARGRSNLGAIAESPAFRVDARGRDRDSPLPYEQTPAAEKALATLRTILEHDGWEFLLHSWPYWFDDWFCRLVPDTFI